MSSQFLKRVGSHPELIILILMVVIIAMLIIPLPTYLIDLLIGMNMVLSILIFLGSFYIDRILNFSSFPSLLLITTLFRLSLSISTSRLILLEANAGEIITSFGNFVIGESLAVGFVVFSIVTIVQFIVITKGSERVAEVAARFSLDGMPGKQMSIDADLRAGIIDPDIAKERRNILERESQLYGSFDGAMKFIKGDAIANIIIIFVNIVGGLAVGVGQNGMDFSTALSVYTILTVGDGLVSQIPALLVAISAGFIVTRVNGDTDNMGKNIIIQLMHNPFVIIVTSILAIALGLLPGFPFFIFMLLSLSLITYYYFNFWKKDQNNSLAFNNEHESKVVSDYDTGQGSIGIIDNLDMIMTETIPLALLVSPKQMAYLKKIQVCDRVKSQFFLEYGIRLPEFIVRESSNINDNEVVLLINEIRAEKFTIYFNYMRVIDCDPDIISSLNIKYEIVNKNEEVFYWVSSTYADKLKVLGYTSKSAVDELYSCLSIYFAHSISEYFGIQETKSMLDQLEGKYPDLLREVLRYITIQRISEVIQRLVQERISVRNMRLIMECLALWTPKEKDIIVIVEHVRGALARYICHKFSVNGEIRAISLSKKVEDMFRDGVRPTSSGTFLNLEPSDSEWLSDIFKVGIQNLKMPTKDVILLTSIDIRRFVKRYLEPAYPELEVLSYGELTDSVSVNFLKTLGK